MIHLVIIIIATSVVCSFHGRKWTRPSPIIWRRPTPSKGWTTAWTYRGTASWNCWSFPSSPRWPAPATCSSSAPCSWTTISRNEVPVFRITMCRLAHWINITINWFRRIPSPVISMSFLVPKFRPSNTLVSKFQSEWPARAKRLGSFSIPIEGADWYWAMQFVEYSSVWWSTAVVPIESELALSVVYQCVVQVKLLIII